nr:RNA-directed DNA polymerase, eukaryota [Tanacetum cinerariifolium]
MGGFHLFANVAKYGRTNNRLDERSGDNKPNEGMNTQPVRDNANVFQSFNSYAKAVLGNKSVGVSGNNDASNSREKPAGVSVSNKAKEESSNEALMFVSKDDCIDLDGMKRSILAKVKDLSVITDLLKYISSEGFVDVGVRYVGGHWVWLESDSTDQVESVKNSKNAERLAHHNNGLDDLDISPRNRLLHQDKCRVRPVATVNDSSIVSLSTPPGTVLNLSEESCSAWLDYVGPLITDELDSEKQ